jgi:predicted nucleic acid-binding Zn ribbon protein
MPDKPLAPILTGLLTRLRAPEQNKKAALMELWPKIAGRFSEHTKPRFGSDGQVIVWVDDSTLAFELSQRYKPTLLKRLTNQFGENEVKDIRFFVGELR